MSATSMFVRHPRLLYWATQVGGWGAFVGGFAAWTYLTDNWVPGLEKVVALEFGIGLCTSHLLRHLVLRNRWLEMDPANVLPRLSALALALSGLAFVLELTLHDLLFSEFERLKDQPTATLIVRLLNWAVLLLIWSLIYFAYTWFVRGRREEIRNLRLETANRENQLSNLRSQLNPHFMFNALNGIRALIDEDPDQAKRAITQLSAILRNAMSTVKRRTVPLGEELDIVKAYLALEAMRYEERLRTAIDVPAELDRIPVPPMLLQTLVENAVRHGIAHLPGGGDLHIGAHRTDGHLVVTVRNSGHYEPGPAKGNGIGLRNTRRRLELIYGKDASITIGNQDGLVVTEVQFPITDPETIAAST
ncbi:MAG TPA: histidine kinase [Flavobacteriales bacterium]|nr:histidine kinase [Flavobacteriales bacterium]